MQFKVLLLRFQRHSGRWKMNTSVDRTTPRAPCVLAGATGVMAVARALQGPFCPLRTVVMQSTTGVTDSAGWTRA